MDPPILIHVHIETRILPHQLSHLLRISKIDSVPHDAPPTKTGNCLQIESKKEEKKEGEKEGEALTARDRGRRRKREEPEQEQEQEENLATRQERKKERKNPP